MNLSTVSCLHCHKAATYLPYDSHPSHAIGDEGWVSYICLSCGNVMFFPPADPLKEPVGPLTTRRTSYSSFKMRNRVYGEAKCLNPACRAPYIKKSPISQTCGDPVCVRWQRTSYERDKRAARVRAQ